MATSTIIIPNNLGVWGIHSVAAEASVDISFPNGFRGFIFTASNVDNAHGMWIFATTNSGGPHLTEVKAASLITVTAATGKLTFAAGSGSGTVGIYICTLAPEGTRV